MNVVEDEAVHSLASASRVSMEGTAAYLMLAVFGSGNRCFTIGPMLAGVSMSALVPGVSAWRG